MSNEGKFTPGPWYVVGHPWDDSGCMINSCPDPHGGELICTTDEGRWHDYTNEDVELWQANARLIAASPEMLTVLHRALQLIGGWREAIVELEDWCSDPVRLKNMLTAADQIDAWRAQARTVIEKANIGR